MKSKPAQLCLLLPCDWIEELDTLAESRFVSRLSLIRSYLRQCMDEEFALYADQLSERERLLSTKNKLDKLIQSRS